MLRPLQPITQSITAPSEIKLLASERVTIGELSDDALLNIFRFYLDVSPQHWPRLVRICRRWRRIVFASQNTLQLRIFCTHGTPVLKTLPRWPIMPTVVQYGGSLELDPPAPEDEDNIISALKRSGHVRSISLTVTRSFLRKLSSIERPFSGLEDLVLWSQDGVHLILPKVFQWGPRLRRLHSTSVAIPGLTQLLHSSTNLVDLQLHDCLYFWQIPPEAFTKAFSGMPRLQSFSLHLLPTDHRYTPLTLPRKRVVLPIITRLNFRGISRYLEHLVARIDTPSLGDIELTFSNTEVIHFPTLREFIDRIGMHKSLRQAHIRSSESAISISLIQPGAPTRLKLELLCESSSERLSFMTQVCDDLSNSLSNVEDVRISTAQTSGRGDSDCSGWGNFLGLLRGVKWFHLNWDHSTNIVRDLQLSDRQYETILPSLHVLYISRPGKPHTLLGKAIVSFMLSGRFSGHTAVEYDRPCYINKPRGTGPLSQRVTSEMLSDDIFLNIFRYYLRSTQRAWPTLTYVCQRWRHIVHISPLGLNLRLHFTAGTPVLKALDCWPALPIIVQYGGVPNIDPPVPEDDDNVVAALKQSDRVSSISLTVTSSLLDKLSAISEPLLELEDLVLLSRDRTQLTLPSTFRWGSCLHTLHSTRIAFPSLPQLLSPSHDLVNIQLHEIPSAGYFSPEAFANALSGMTQLETLSLHFISFPPRRTHLSLPPPSGGRVVLPALTCLKYRGTSKYLDSLVARIDAPRLGEIDITFFSQPTMDALQLGRFIERTGIRTSFRRTNIRMSDDTIAISFISSGTSAPLLLRISCKQLDWQLSSMAQISEQFSPFLFRMKDLRITKSRPSNELDDADGEQWLGPIRAFGGATDLRVADRLTTAILCALGVVEEGHTAVLPNLRRLHIENPKAMNGPSWNGLLSFLTLRSRPGRLIQVNVPFEQCQICHASVREKKGLERHLSDKHGYRILCSYCGHFERKAGQEDLFRKHLIFEHLEAWRDDERIGNPWLTAVELDSLVTQHSSLRAPGTVAPPHRPSTPQPQRRTPIAKDSNTRRNPSVT